MNVTSVLLLALFASPALQGQPSTPTDRAKLDTARKQFQGTKPCLGHAIDQYTFFDGMAVSPDGQQAFAIRWLDPSPARSIISTAVFTGNRCVVTGGEEVSGKHILQVVPASLAINKRSQVGYVAYWNSDSCFECHKAGVFIDSEWKFDIDLPSADFMASCFKLNDDGTITRLPITPPAPASNPYLQHEAAPVQATPKTDPIPDKTPPLVIPPSKPAAAKACAEAKPKKRIIGFDPKKLGDLAKKAGIPIDVSPDSNGKPQPCPAAPAK